MGKITVGILFGGKSSEHEISLMSAKNIVNAINKNKYDLVLIGIDKNGKWFLKDDGGILLNGADSKKIFFEESRGVALIPESKGTMMDFKNSAARKKIDVVFPVLHGAFGEDGTVQGLLKLADIPFVGAGVLGSAIGMDKDAMKRLLRDAGILIADFLVVKKSEAIPDYEEIKKRLGEIFFIKPANAGSSVGISKIHGQKEYLKAVESAFIYDRKILIEEGINGREIECSVLGNENPIASVPGEVIPKHEFYSYEAKYLDEHGATLEVPAKLPKAVSEKIADLAVKTFKVLCCEGMARVDFFLKEDGSILVNEINTIPGFTAISMYPRLWEASGIGYGELIERLIDLAIERFEAEKNIKTSYNP